MSRPVVPVTLVGSEVAPTSFALVDSGCEHVLAAPWLAVAAGIDAEATERELTLGIGGDNVQVRFHELTLRLHPGPDDAVFWEWRSEVGFPSTWRPTWPVLVGQRGFFDEFTVTMSRMAQETVVERAETFDERFPIQYLS